ncbi:hypothetical protein BaRGS_00021145 [Batillaria attramentaria]|uniref:Uncharacterized protein n=1 Tax=Batillaria attramentaria TaxID=370345 RepID=A0ABD0KKS9_9CAEN
MTASSVCLIVHVLFVCLVTGVSVKVEDATRPNLKLQDHKLLYLDKSTRRMATGWGDGDDENLCPEPYWISEDYTVCGDGYCRCRDTVADCSGYQAPLAYVPRLPTGILQVVFTFNELRTVSRENFFSNITHVADLDLSYNHVTFISHGVFRRFTNLTALRLVYNKLTYDSLSPVLSIGTLTVLDLSFNPLGSPPDGIFHKYPLPKLESLCLNGINLASLKMEVLLTTAAFSSPGSKRFHRYFRDLPE